LICVGAAVLLSQMGAFRPVECWEHYVGFSQVVPVVWAFYLGSGGSFVSIRLGD
jgi:hypothetical protein